MNLKEEKMTEEIKFDNLKQLNDVLKIYKENGTAHISIEKKIILRDVYRNIYGLGIQVDLSCSNCVVMYLTFLHSYFEREWPIYLAKLEAEKIVEQVNPAVAKTAKK